MKSLRELKGRIRSIVKIRDVTKAMKTASAGKYRKALALLAEGRVYVQRIEAMAARVDLSESGHPMARSHGGVPLLVVISSDRGLCGGFNTALFRFVEAFQAKQGGADVKYFAIGKKVDDWCRRTHRSLAASLVNVMAKFSEERLAEVENRIVELFVSGKCSEVHVFYNEFRNVMDRRPKHVTLFPVAPLPDGKGVRHSRLRLLPDQTVVLDYLLPRYACSRVRLALLESNAAEQAARMTTMDGANRNADELLDTLKLDYQKARQLSITRELADLTTGAEAMK